MKMSYFQRYCMLPGHETMPEVEEAVKKHSAVLGYWQTPKSHDSNHLPCSLMPVSRKRARLEALSGEALVPGEDVR